MQSFCHFPNSIPPHSYLANVVRSVTRIQLRRVPRPRGAPYILPYLPITSYQKFSSITKSVPACHGVPRLCQDKKIFNLSHFSPCYGKTQITFQTVMCQCARDSQYNIIEAEIMFSGRDGVPSVTAQAARKHNP